MFAIERNNFFFLLYSLIEHLLNGFSEGNSLIAALVGQKYTRYINRCIAYCVQSSQKKSISSEADLVAAAVVVLF